MQGDKPRARAIGAVVLTALLCARAAAETNDNPSASSILEPAVWQGPAINAQSNAATGGSNSAAASSSRHSFLNPLWMALQPAPPVPPQTIQTPTMTKTNPQGARTPSNSAQPTLTQPLLDGDAPIEELTPPVVEDGCIDSNGQLHVKPYGGGHPTDWPWGCGGSPYRTGPGMCDNYRVGPRWHITVDGMVMSREKTDLGALTLFMSDPGYPIQGGIGVELPATENFSYGPGGRISFTSQIARCVGYDVQAVYEGINDWNASIVFPKQALPDISGTLVIPPDPDTEPGSPFPEGFQQRSLHYRSNMNSGELNFLTNYDPTWRPYFGVRFIQFDDEINDSLNQERQVPLPGPRTDALLLVTDPIGPTWETDRVNLFHLRNNLMGFQIGLLHDTVRLNDRFAIEGFVNGGVYYNQIKYSNVMGVYTTQTFADNTRSLDGTGAGRTDTSSIVNNDARDLSEISYVSEASITGVCRLNKCWALRAGYQILWIGNLHLADAAFLGNPDQSDNLRFQGWHAGIECRR